MRCQDPAERERLARDQRCASLAIASPYSARKSSMNACASGSGADSDSISTCLGRERMTTESFTLKPASCRTSGGSGTMTEPPTLRSEEHTSELQSQSNL